MVSKSYDRRKIKKRHTIKIQEREKTSERLEINEIAIEFERSFEDINSYRKL